MTTPTAERVRKHREGLRTAGLRPVQLWVPDTRQAGFTEECRRQSRLVASVQANNADAADAQAWLEQAADTDGWH